MRFLLHDGFFFAKVFKSDTFCGTIEAKEVFAMHPILVVDDEQAIAMLIRRILTDAGYRCEAVTDSIKAADLLP